MRTVSITCCAVTSSHRQTIVPPRGARNCGDGKYMASMKARPRCQRRERRRGTLLRLQHRELALSLLDERLIRLDLAPIRLDGVVGTSARERKGQQNHRKGCTRDFHRSRWLIPHIKWTNIAQCEIARNRSRR